MTTAVATGAAALSAADRCDRCGAQAYLKVELLSGGELLFCAHHAREHGDALKAVAVTRDRRVAPTRRHPVRPGRRLRSPPPTDRPTAPDHVSGAVGCVRRVTAVSPTEVLVALAILVGLVGVIVPILPGLGARPRRDPGVGRLRGVGHRLGGLRGRARCSSWRGRWSSTPSRTAGSRTTGIPSSTTWFGVALGVVGFFVIPVIGLFIGFVLGVYLAEYRRVGGAAAWPSTKEALRAVGRQHPDRARRRRAGRARLGRRSRRDLMAVVLSLLAALSYGLADFCGGMASKRASAWAVALVASATGGRAGPRRHARPRRRTPRPPTSGGERPPVSATASGRPSSTAVSPRDGWAWSLRSPASARP